MSWLLSCALLSVSISGQTSITVQTSSVPTLDSLFQRFWSADSVEDRDKAASLIVKRKAPFDDVHARLKTGRPYRQEVPTGRLLRERVSSSGLRHPYMILIPEDYSPDQALPVRFDLHGGMGAPEWKKLDGAWSPGWRRARGQIVIAPAGWWDSMWWEWNQVENFEAILAEVRRTWNIDHNRVVLYGNSDGGAALFFHAMRQPDRWAGYAGHVAPPDRLVRAQFRPDGQMHVSNLAHQRFHLGYGEKDPKVPLRHLKKYLALFEEQGAQLDWYVLPGQGHSLNIPQQRLQDLAKFLFKTTRDPLPDTLTWSTERVDRYSRRQWLVIDKLAGKRSIDKTNILPRWGTAIQRRGPTATRKPWGRVTLRRDGNSIIATTTNVSRFRLLLCPDEFDLSEPITVEVNGTVLFQDKVTASVKTLLKWAAIDDDPTRLFAAELTIEPKP